MISNMLSTDTILTIGLLSSLFVGIFVGAALGWSVRNLTELGKLLSVLLTFVLSALEALEKAESSPLRSTTDQAGQADPTGHSTGPIVRNAQESGTILVPFTIDKGGKKDYIVSTPRESPDSLSVYR